MKRRYFGTDGVRGPYGGPVINESFAAQLGEAVGRWLRAPSGGKVLIGRDTRGSGPALTQAVARGLIAAGLRPIDLGVLPTPAVARAVREGDAVLGVVITASHNPATDNGIKFFDRDGTKLSDADEVAIEALLPAGPATGTGVIESADDALRDYIISMTKTLPSGSLEGWRVVLDTANGATVGTSPVVVRALGAEVVNLGAQPDGQNINLAVGSEHPERLAAAVVSHQARLGIAHDGDGDRCVLCDETGVVLDGDEILTILATHALARNELAAKTLVVTIQSNLGVDAAVRAAGGRVWRTDVGDRYVSERLREVGAGLGGESSGHIICPELGPTGDGLGAALRVLGVMIETGQPLSVLRQALHKFPQMAGALRVTEKRPLAECGALAAEMTKLESELAENGRILVRYSGTESKLRFLVEGPTMDVVTHAYERLVSAAGRDLELG